jgi:uncharacterized membrane protein
VKSTAVILLFLAMLYPYYGIRQPYNSLKDYKSLDITTSFKNSNPDDYAAIQWLSDTEHGQPTILEANGDSYSNYCRFSIYTGLPTILGWYVHEWYWRGNNSEKDNRVKEVSTVYESNDISATKEILKKYKVKYIILGNLELEKFKGTAENSQSTNVKVDKLYSLGKVVFDRPNIKIIQVSN